jgi:hypothetical protein
MAARDPKAIATLLLDYLCDVVPMSETWEVVPLYPERPNSKELRLSESGVRASEKDSPLESGEIRLALHFPARSEQATVGSQFIRAARAQLPQIVVDLAQKHPKTYRKLCSITKILTAPPKERPPIIARITALSSCTPTRQQVSLPITQMVLELPLATIHQLGKLRKVDRLLPIPEDIVPRPRQVDALYSLLAHFGVNRLGAITEERLVRARKDWLKYCRGLFSL